MFGYNKNARISRLEDMLARRDDEIKRYEQFMERQNIPTPYPIGTKFCSLGHEDTRIGEIKRIFSTKNIAGEPVYMYLFQDLLTGTMFFRMHSSLAKGHYLVTEEK